VAKVFMHHGTPMTAAPPQPFPFSAKTGGEQSLWIPLVQRTVATDGAGMPELIESIRDHAAHLHQSGDWARRERTRLSAEFDLFIQNTLLERFRATLPEDGMSQMLDLIQSRILSPREAAMKLMER